MREYHYLLLRCSIQILIQLVWLNTHFKYYVYDSLTKHDFHQLQIRVGIGFFALTCQIIALRALPLVLVSLVMNTMPLFTAVFGYFMLSERLKILEKVCLVLSFVGVAIMITGKDSSSIENKQGYSTIAIIALCLNPVLSSLVTITLRTLRNISVHTQAFYHAFVLSTVMGIVVLITQDYMSFLYQFSYYDYFLLISAAFFALIHQLLKQMAVQYNTASRVTIYNYLQSLVQLIFDILIFDYNFQLQELLGILLVFLVNLFLIFKIISKKEEK
ncbi:membrane protein [Stylonychia lemnae]|uniref:Membrane protein n=1 Tax=Stylonychia lemnae TaxID=5949 RepID=A0A077ZU57_STYLE|nr:membrane protein [Stylonychia lemnae]|eukprot:CDW73109.1 membrane protein [Stylonychia lemnae]